MALNNGRISVKKTGVQANRALICILREEGVGSGNDVFEILLEISFVFFPMSFFKACFGEKLVVVFQIADP